MNWAKNDVAYNSDSKLFFFSFVAFACGQMSSYPLAVIRTQQQAQGNTSLTQLQILTIMFDSLPCGLIFSFQVRFQLNLSCIITWTSRDI